MWLYCAAKLCPLFPLEPGDLKDLEGEGGTWCRGDLLNPSKLDDFDRLTDNEPIDLGFRGLAVPAPPPPLEVVVVVVVVVLTVLFPGVEES